jgi:hypothetical protein
MAETSATAEGDLGRTPFGHLLVYALDRRLTGAVFLKPPEGEKHVLRLMRGVPVKVRPGDTFARLGEMLVAAGAIDEATLQAALATKGLLGDMLLLAGRIERDRLEAIAQEQFLRRMVRFFDLPKETTFAYFDGHEELAEYGGDPASVDPLAILWAGLSAHAERSAMMEPTLALLGDKPLRLHAAATVSRMALGAEEARLVDALAAKPMSLAEWIAAGEAPAEQVRRLAYALTITRQIDTGAGTMPLGAVDSSRGTGSGLFAAVSAPAAAPSAPTAVARMALKSTMYRVGAAAPDLPGDGERVVRPRRARSDTDEVPSTERSSGVPEPSGEPISSVKPVSAEAAVEQSGIQPRSPASVPQAHAEPPPSSAKVAPAEADPFAGRAAAELLGLAKVLIAGRDAKAAVAACEAARKVAPSDPDVAALAAWARFQAGAADLKVLVVQLDELLAEHDGHVAARYYRAMMRKRLSDQAGCAADLRRVLELAHDHAEAQRELTALERKPALSERPSLFGKLFKR